MLQKVRVYLNAEFMDLLEFYAGFCNVSPSEILRFSLQKRSENGFYKKTKRTQSIFSKQKCVKKDFATIKKKQNKLLPLPYFASNEFA